MAARKRSTRRERAPVIPFPDQPFIVDYPDPEDPRRFVRKFWVLPDGTYDREDAYRIGQRWAGHYIDGQKATAGEVSALHRIIEEMAIARSRRSDADGFQSGFLNILMILAYFGATQCGGAACYVERRTRYYEEAAHKREEAQRERNRDAVARMNAARAVKRIAKSAREAANG